MVLLSCSGTGRGISANLTNGVARHNCARACTTQNWVEPSVSPPMREWNSRGKFTTTSYSLSQPTKAHGSNQLLLLFCKCDALLPAKFHGIQDLLEAGMMADIGQQRIDAQPSGAVVAFAHGTVQPLDGPVGFAEDGIRFCCIERREGLQVGVFEHLLVHFLERQGALPLYCMELRSYHARPEVLRVLRPHPCECLPGFWQVSGVQVGARQAAKRGRIPRVLLQHFLEFAHGLRNPSLLTA